MPSPDRPLQRAQIFELCAELEGHPDNAAPAEFGGFNVARRNRHQAFPSRAAPAFRPSDSRILKSKRPKRAGVLPNRIDRLRAVESLRQRLPYHRRLCLRQYRNLRGAFVRLSAPTFPSEIRSLSRSSDRCRGRCRRAWRFPERLRLDHCLPSPFVRRRRSPKPCSKLPV